MTYDAQNRLTSVGSYVTSILYSPGNDPSTFYYGNGATQSFSYDARDRLSGTGSTSYGLDGVGNVGANGYNGVTYGYNGLNELTGTTGGWLGTTKYTYDTAGNLLSMKENGVTTTLNYPTKDYFNELQNTSVNKVTKTTYTYDKDGNMITRNGTACQFYYNDLDQLTKVVKSGQTVETNVYDGFGRRISRTVGSVTTTYAYIGDEVLYEQNSTGGTVTGKVLHIYGDGQEVAEVVNGVTYYPVQNYVGSIVAVRTGSGATSFSANYYPWGRISVTKFGSETLKFTEMPYDSVTGLYFFGTRFYDPTIGRFIQPDSSAGVLSDPLSLNAYAYAGNNPVTFSDPTGHGWLSDAWNWLQGNWETVAVVGGISAGVAVAWLGIFDCPATIAAGGSYIAGILGIGGAAAADELLPEAELPDDALVVRGGLNSYINNISEQFTLHEYSLLIPLASRRATELDNPVES